jgi:hypothetical protein
VPKKPENEPSPLLNIKESCAYLGVAPSTLYLVVMPRTGIVKVGGRTFLRRRNVDAYLAANSRPPTKPLKRDDYELTPGAHRRPNAVAIPPRGKAKRDKSVRESESII